MFVRICIFIMTLWATQTLGVDLRKTSKPPHTHLKSSYALFDTIQYPEADSLATHVTERNQRLYDSIETKTSRNKFSNLLYKLLFVDPDIDDRNAGTVIDENALLKPYEGKTIGRIDIVRSNIFPEAERWVERTSNKLHVLTREKIIRRDLLFKSGEKLDADLIVRTQHLLRSRPYIYDTEVVILADSADSTRVNIMLCTRDSWTISLEANLHSEKRADVGIYDGNIFGTGNKLKFKTSFNWKTFEYGGNSLSYEMPNVLGSFYATEFEVGRCFFEENFKMAVHKDFLKPTDYEFGASFTNIRSKYYMIELDSMDLAKTRNFDLWGGYAHYVPKIGSSLFLTVRYNRERFGERPLVYYRYNPAFHDHDDFLIGMGLYRERFIAANMIYGFGMKEYLATGYKAEVVTGYSWGEFNDKFYLGLACKSGRFRSWGYVMGSFSLGSYIDWRSGKWTRSAVDVNMIWFSNLIHMGRNRLRQFVKINYTQGWNRTRGNNERIRFTKWNGLQSLKEYAIGTNRLAINTETVMFTPIQPLGFRFAFFGFADMGLLGNAANMFQNKFFSTVGLGLRIKNERLIFSEIQIRLGIAFGHGGWLDSDYFRLSNGTRLEQVRYSPSRPDPVDFE